MAEPAFDKVLHLKYWRRCLKSLLPTEYTSTDSSRMSLGFFILAALDILGEGADTLPPKEKSQIKTWILNCEHPNGGFCGSPNHKYPMAYYYDNGRKGGPPDMDPANLPATFFALLALNFVGKVTDADRNACLRWLRKMQRQDGSFGEVLGKNGEVKGGRDMRYCLCAAAIRWILRGDIKSNSRQEVEDIDVDGLVRHIRGGETYDGGIGESSEHESHAGYTYCGIAALSYLDRLPKSISSPWTSYSPDEKLRGLTNLQDTTRWLMTRHVEYIGSDEEEDEEEQENTAKMSLYPGNGDEDIPSTSGLSLEDKHFIGCNGRVNKRPDTCYSFWVGASLDMIGQGKLIDKDGARRWLVEKTQHRIGGFGKEPGYPPDIYHSYLGLATLSMLSTSSLIPLDPVLCVSNSAKSKIERDMEEYFRPDPPGKSVWDTIMLVGAPKVKQEPNSEPPKEVTEAMKKYDRQKREGTLGPEWQYEERFRPEDFVERKEGEGY